MFDKAINDLIAVIADGFAGHVDQAIVSQDEMRAKREEYRSGISGAAQRVAADFQAGLTEAMRQRFADWLVHPRLGHGALIDEGRSADNEFQRAIVDHQKSPSPSTIFAVTLAMIRLAAIARVLGPECIILDPPPRETKKPRKKNNDARMKRRQVGVADVPRDLVGTVAMLAPGDEHRDAAMTDLLAASAQDMTGVAAKIHSIAARPTNDAFITELAAAAARMANPQTPATPASTNGPDKGTPRLHALDSDPLRDGEHSSLDTVLRTNDAAENLNLDAEIIDGATASAIATLEEWLRRLPIMLSKFAMFDGRWVFGETIKAQRYADAYLLVADHPAFQRLIDILRTSDRPQS